jgi:uncharacterized protein (TIGR02757 family)
MRMLFLEAARQRHHSTAFLQTDPVQFPRRYLANSAEAELVGFLAALLSYGYRPLVLAAIENLLARMDHQPLAYLFNTPARQRRADMASFYYRLNKGADVAWLLGAMASIYDAGDTLETVWMRARPSPTASLHAQMQAFYEALVAVGGAPNSRGAAFLLPNPALGGACKRLHLFLRWMVRSDAAEPPEIDTGLWQRALRPSALLIPLDVHVARVARGLGLTARKTDNWKTAEEITAALRHCCPEDPIRYDIALMGLGLTLSLEGRQARIKKPEQKQLTQKGGAV